MLILLCIVVVYSIVVTTLLIYKYRPIPLASSDDTIDLMTSTLSYRKVTTIGLLTKYNKYGRRTVKLMEY